MQLCCISATARASDSRSAIQNVNSLFLHETCKERLSSGSLPRLCFGIKINISQTQDHLAYQYKDYY